MQTKKPRRCEVSSVEIERTIFGCLATRQTAIALGIPYASGAGNEQLDKQRIAQ